ncbi:hypothetical protein PTTG_05455 [Puccinia triticina 1-1 BBBD Race 1]|uniref:Uncharacterized protein n=2 Tax=Puccinia triticina TaxID=208348 RepID=A0A0C4EXA7_PUCT1|nr:uncharacterized protein PtA15_6A573 [Puccinia triticina]OAV95405.1 hypothetical protein PTTG_05455 [Puccinia triticina 1-1 BBBD Race 1]WAQ85944.1 hypothetical protein PtA15_6A573 [Puccinia triticina]WAR55839.1 hypothetical protein PtB15_6B582 [Puccinia triticina]
MIDNFNFIPVIKPWNWKDIENQDEDDKSQECRTCKKRKVREEFYRGQWTNDPERATYRRTCRNCRDLPPAIQATAAEPDPPGEKDITGLIGPLSRQVLLDLTNDPSRLIREEIFEHLRLSSLSDYEHLQPPSESQRASGSPKLGSSGTGDRELDEPKMGAGEDRQRAKRIEPGLGDNKKELSELVAPTRLAVTSVCVSVGGGSQGRVTSATATSNLPKLERSFTKRWPSTTTLGVIATGADGRSAAGPHDPNGSEGSTRIPRRSRIKSVP